VFIGVNVVDVERVAHVRAKGEGAEQARRRPREGKGERELTTFAALETIPEGKSGY